MFSFRHHQSTKGFLLRFVFSYLHMMQDSCQQQSSDSKSYLYMLLCEDDRFFFFHSIFMFSLFFPSVLIFMAVDNPYLSALFLNLIEDSFYFSCSFSLEVIHGWLHLRRQYISNLDLLFIPLFTLIFFVRKSDVSMVHCYQCASY